MALFAVIWSYTTDASVKEAAHAEHLIFVKDAAARGLLQEAGAWVDGAGALLVFKADSEDALRSLLAEDPYVKQGVVVGERIYQWNPVIGPLVGV
ncbi:YciI family protein [Rhodococcus sp. USK13]|uniref:YciI family protein n=1 Tax=Rhodococcus sp. USK13 TaxID=2806442 RepID=UPI001BCE1507|nr:YciI family protein [Rhodococcus sp. USK13]